MSKLEGNFIFQSGSTAQLLKKLRKFSTGFLRFKKVFIVYVFVYNMYVMLATI